ncbi:SDR family oxidoreductase [Hyalangium versicolor]|uniref:SDR family oxidoreductase n=1 Tax=Hyalangium versicolor TaxID=2861190 RepID=UPI001CCC62E8|nr:SDR family oxidoreductase [Hyalangium versicolor]
MILVTGATGTIGRALIPELRAKSAHVRVMTRDPEKAKSLWGPEADIVRGDFTEPSSLPPALDGVSELFLLTAPSPAISDHDVAMVKAAKAARVRKIVKLSVFGADAAEPLTTTGWHLPGERAVKESGLAWTLLRPAAFASNALGWVPLIRSGVAIELSTGNGKHALVDPRDVAAVAARSLLSHDHDSQAYTLTGPEPLSAREQVEVLGKVLARPISFEEVTVDVAVERMRSSGVPDAYAAAVKEGLLFVREGRAAMRSDAVERVLGRAPRSFEQWVRDHISLFR